MLILYKNFLQVRFLLQAKRIRQKALLFVLVL